MKLSKKLSWFGIVLTLFLSFLVLGLTRSNVAFETVRDAGFLSGVAIATLALIAVMTDYLATGKRSRNNDDQDVPSDYQTILEDLEQLEVELNELSSQDRQIRRRLQDSGTTEHQHENEQDEQIGQRLAEG